MNFPAPNPNPDMTEVIVKAEEWLKHRIVGEMDSSAESMIFGPLMQAIYGKDIFDRIDAIATKSRTK
jgi:hypothetical protein